MQYITADGFPVIQGSIVLGVLGILFDVALPD
jgi:hypothetical protein